MVSEFISVNEQFSGLSLLLIVTMLGWSVTSSSERFKTDSEILGFTKDSFSVQNQFSLPNFDASNAWQQLTRGCISRARTALALSCLARHLKHR